mgnify:CR=1 FL=1
MANRFQSESNRGQFLVEALLTLLMIILITFAVFIVFSALPNILRYSEESLISSNFVLSYQNILNGLARENFGSFDNLETEVDYFATSTATGFKIEEGREEFSLRAEKYYTWFRVVSSSVEGDPNRKLLVIYVQTPSAIYGYNLFLTRWLERVLFQDFWRTINVGPLTTITDEYATKTENIFASDTIQLK